MMPDEQYNRYLRQRSTLGLLYRFYWLYPRIARHLHGKVLDVGCGIGDFVSYRAETIGVDINSKNVEWCIGKGLDVCLMKDDVLPFPTDSFEGVVLDNVLEHIEEPSMLLGEIYRVLKISGILIVGVPGKRGYAIDPDHKVFYGEEELEAMMAKQNFSLRRILYAPFRSTWLNAHMRQYCIYGVFERA